MRISAVRQHEEQERLWPWVGDRPITTAASRNYCGEFYEEASRVCLGAHRHAIDGTADVCPDLSLAADPDHFLEVKSLRTGRNGLIYTNRLEKDLELARGHHLTYLFWIHDAPAAGCASLHELRLMLARNTVCLLAIPLEGLAKVCAGLTPRVANYRIASATRPRQEMPAYRVPWGALLSLSGAKAAHPGDVRTPARAVFDCLLPSVPVFSRRRAVLSAIASETRP